MKIQDRINLTFDLETLGRTTTAPIVQIGAVKFNDYGEILDTFLQTVDIESLEEYGLSPEYPVIKWWLSQNDLAIKSVFCDTNEVPIKEALDNFMKWIGTRSHYTYWSHATFDAPILAYNMIKAGCNRLLPYKAHRDIRTLNHFVGQTTAEREGIHHNALDDAMFQAKYIAEGISKIKIAMT